LDDPRIHSAVVCASRGCPPLRREAYVEGRLDEQLDDNTRAWLANPQWNEFIPARNIANVSKIFDWYRKDFEINGGSVQSFLAKYAPPGNDFLRQRPQFRYKDYHWGLNSTSALGLNYSRLNFWWDAMRNK
jgi:hypothetical protein